MDEPVVEIKNGKIRGIRKRSIDNFGYSAFLGIPYAVPPVGDLRFKDPLPLTEKWSGIRSTMRFGQMCAQYDAFVKKSGGCDDCLYLNVYVKTLKNVNGLKPVMFLIHGGGWMFGSGDDMHFGPDYLLRKDVVLVTFNYRLGVLGFLNLEDEIAPGNVGLKDQIMALKWVQENIETFGGDPKNVTIFGESAGGICAHYLALSPLARGLFHKVISQSGTVLNPSAWIKNPRKYAIELCNFLGAHLTDSKEIIDFLKTVDCNKIAKAQEGVRRVHEKLQGLFPFCPAIDSKSSNPVMPIPVEEAVISHGVQVPFLVGHNDREGICILIDPFTFQGLKEEDYASVDKNIRKVINDRAFDLLKDYNLTPWDLKQIYFGNDKVSRSNGGKLADLVGDLNLVVGIQKTVKLQAQHSTAPTYYYKFSYSDDLSMMKSLLSVPVDGACHFDEMEYLFLVNLRLKLGFSPPKKGTRGYRVMERMTEMWTNFAKYGNPTPTISSLLPIEWDPVDSVNLRCLNIGRELRMETPSDVEQLYLSAKRKEK